MTWTYRIVRDSDGIHRIAEVYTDPKRNTMWTKEPCYPIGEDLPELRRDMLLMLRAFRMPVLDEATLRETIENETQER